MSAVCGYKSVLTFTTFLTFSLNPFSIHVHHVLGFDVKAAEMARGCFREHPVFALLPRPIPCNTGGEVLGER